MKLNETKQALRSKSIQNEISTSTTSLRLCKVSEGANLSLFYLYNNRSAHITDKKI